MKILSLIILDYRGGYAYHNTLEEGDGQRRDPQGKDIAGQNNDWTNSVRIADGLGKQAGELNLKILITILLNMCTTIQIFMVSQNVTYPIYTNLQ